MRDEGGQKLLAYECCPLVLHLSLKSVLVLPAISSLSSPAKDCLLGHTESLHCGDTEPRRRSGWHGIKEVQGLRLVGEENF